jgi:hypothetical protein
LTNMKVQPLKPPLNADRQMKPNTPVKVSAMTIAERAHAFKPEPRPPSTPQNLRKLDPSTPGRVTLPRPVAERPQASEPEPRPPNTPQHSRKPFCCRECGGKGAWPAAGWYTLRRRILRGSVPPEVLNDEQRKAWARSVEQGMGTYCSLACIERSMGRLKELDQKFREKGVGTAPLING